MTTPTLREALDAHEWKDGRCACSPTLMVKGYWRDHREAAVREALGEHLIEASSDAALEAEPATHEHRPEYPSACTGCEHLAADLVSRMPPGLRAAPAAPPASEPPSRWPDDEAAVEELLRLAHGDDFGAMFPQDWEYEDAQRFLAALGAATDAEAVSR